MTVSGLSKSDLSKTLSILFDSSFSYLIFNPSEYPVTSAFKTHQKSAWPSLFSVLSPWAISPLCSCQNFLMGFLTCVFFSSTPSSQNSPLSYIMSSIFSKTFGSSPLLLVNGLQASTRTLWFGFCYLQSPLQVSSALLALPWQKILLFIEHQVYTCLRIFALACSLTWNTLVPHTQLFHFLTFLGRHPRIEGLHNHCI